MTGIPFSSFLPGCRVDLSYSIQDRKVYDEVELEARYSGPYCPPNNRTSRPCLGDSSDNIPGVPKHRREAGRRACSTSSATWKGIYERLERGKAAQRQGGPRGKPGAGLRKPGVLTTIDRHSARGAGPGRPAALGSMTGRLGGRPHDRARVLQRNPAPPRHRARVRNRRRRRQPRARCRRLRRTPTTRRSRPLHATGGDAGLA